MADNFENKVLNSMLRNSWLGWSLAFGSWLLVQIALYMTFIYAPAEKVMGPVQRIFYFHVGSAVACYLMMALVFVGSVCFLSTRARIWDMVAESSVVVGFLFASIVLGTGMVWGHSAWNVWWRWEPRLVSSLVLWLLLLAYLVFRMFSKEHINQRSSAAVVGIISSIQVPIVIFSIKMMGQAEQLHPQIAENQGLTDPRYTQALLVTMAALTFLSLWLFYLRLSQVISRELIDDLDFSTEASKLERRVASC